MPASRRRCVRGARGHVLALLLLLVLTAGLPTAVQALVPLALDDAPGVAAWLALAIDTVLYFPVTAIGLTASALAARATSARAVHRHLSSHEPPRRQ